MTSQESAGPASDPIERAVAHDSIRLSDLLTAANARNKEYVADLELLSIEKGQLKERVAELEPKPCCQEWDTCTNRCVPLANELRQRIAALEAEKAERVLEPWDLIEGLKKDRAAALSQWKAAEARGEVRFEQQKL